ncbi:MAG: hypothetical protein R3308_00470 [Thiohalobacterales bacterium]|nr:hypothetical protein [Thiohalobacterales bacterium]
MTTATPAISDRTNAGDAVEFILGKLDAYDTRLLDWVRLYPMTDTQHQPAIAGETPPATLSTCWTPRDTLDADEPPQPQHMYRIKVNVWQGNDYPARERNWGRIPAIPIRRRGIPDRYTTRGLCEWTYPDRLAATVHALARPLFLFLAHTGQVCETPSNSNASAMGHRWVVEWLRRHGQQHDADALAAQLVQWTLIQSKGL